MSAVLWGDKRIIISLTRFSICNLNPDYATFIQMYYILE